MRSSLGIWIFRPGMENMLAMIVSLLSLSHTAVSRSRDSGEESATFVSGSSRISLEPRTATAMASLRTCHPMFASGYPRTEFAMITWTRSDSWQGTLSARQLDGCVQVINFTMENQ